MNIVYIGGEPYPGSQGGSVHFGEVSTGLVKLGHKVLAVIPYEPGMPLREQRDGMDIVRVPMKFRNRTFPLFALRAWRCIKRFKPDMIMERYVTFGGAGTVIARRWNIPLILEVNSPHTEELIYRIPVRNRLMQKIMRSWRDWQFNRAVAILATLPTVIPERYRDKFIQVQWAANCDMFDRSAVSETAKKRLKEKLRLSDEPVVAFLGTFRNWHGVKHLPSIIKQVVDVLPNAKCIAVGEGDERRAVQKEVKRLGIEKSVIFTGSVPYTDVPAYLSLATVGIAPYDCDEYLPLKQFGFFWSPLKIFEYMASGMPVITIDVEPLNQVVADGERGFVVPEGNWSMFAEKIIKLLQNKDICFNMGITAREFASIHYSWNGHVRQIAAILESFHGDHL